MNEHDPYWIPEDKVGLALDIIDAARKVIDEIPGYALKDGLTPSEQHVLHSLVGLLARWDATDKETGG